MYVGMHVRVYVCVSTCACGSPFFSTHCHFLCLLSGFQMQLHCIKQSLFLLF